MSGASPGEMAEEWLDRELRLAEGFHDIRGALTVVQGSVDLMGGSAMLSGASERILRLFEELSQQTGLPDRVVELTEHFAGEAPARVRFRAPVLLFLRAVNGCAHRSSRVGVGPTLVTVTLVGVSPNFEAEPGARRLRVAARLCGALRSGLERTEDGTNWTTQFLGATVTEGPAETPRS